MDSLARSPAWTGRAGATRCASSMSAARPSIVSSRPHGAGVADARSAIGQGRRVKVAIERPDGPVIEALFGADLEVVVIASRHIKAIRIRYGTAGNKDDRSDAYMLADVLRTDGHRLRPLRPDSPETVTLRATVRARKDLVQTRTRLIQQLRAHLELVFPGAVGLFSDLASPIALRFLLRFPSAPKAAGLSTEADGGLAREARGTPAGRVPRSCAGGSRQLPPASSGPKRGARGGDPRLRPGDPRGA